MSEKNDVVYQSDAGGDLEVPLKPQITSDEQEPATGYSLGLKTWLAVLALAFATASAVVATTVCLCLED